MIRVTLSAFSSPEDAAAVARTLVEEKLAACATILPGARSIYRWQGAIEDAPETAVLFKVPEPAYPRFAERLLALHPYQTPEIVAWSADDSSPAYAAWAFASCGLKV